MIDTSTDYKADLSRWVLDVTRHSMHVELMVKVMEDKGYHPRDPERPHDLVGLGNKFELNVMLGLSQGYRLAGMARELKEMLPAAYPELRYLSGFNNGELKGKLLGISLSEGDPLFNDLMYFRALHQRIEEARQRHNTNQYHHKVWNGKKTPGSDEEVLFGAIDALCSKREDRPYVGRALTWEEIRVGIQFEEEMYKQMAFGVAFEVLSLQENPALELIVDPYDFPNLGIPTTIYQKMRELAAAAQDKVSRECKHLLNPKFRR